MITLYKRNAQSKPIFWEVEILANTFGIEQGVMVRYGLVGTKGRIEHINSQRDYNKEVESLVKAKRKEGYKALGDIYDNAPMMLEREDLVNYLNTYLPKNNTHEDGAFIPMLCKTLEDNKPFEKGNYFGQWKINGERCIITAEVEKSLFERIRLKYRSREGVDWTSKLDYLDDYILPCIPKKLLDMMIEEGVGLDGELYLPGYGINEINSFIKNDKVPQHYQLQYWLYDLCIENMSAEVRQNILVCNFATNLAIIGSKEDHLNNKARLVLLPSTTIDDFNAAIRYRDLFIYFGFEGLVIRKKDAEYQFGGKRNNSMLKFKKVYDGWFEIIDVVPEGKKRSHLGKFVLKNDINDSTFDCTYNAPHYVQEQLLKEKDKYIGKLAFVEYRERINIDQKPFHAKALKIKNK